MNWRNLIVAALALGAYGPAAAQDVGPQRVRYDGFKQVHVQARTVREHQTVLALTHKVMTCSGSGVGWFDVAMSPEQYTAFAQTGIPHEVPVQDLQALFDAERDEIQRINHGDNPGFFDTYHTLTEINQYVAGLGAAHPTLAVVSSAGKTLQGRDITMIRITGPGDRTGRPVLLFNATQHAREWVAPAVAVYIADQLLANYVSDPHIRRLVDSMEWVIVPVVNADGYEHTWTTDRMWRKNLRPPPSGSFCFGVDTNRNWGFQWGLNIGSSGNACDETYRGPSAFSEPETRVLRDLFLGAPRLKGHIDLHSFGQLILEPWGFTPAPPPDQAQIQAISALMADAIYAVHGQEYVHGPGYTTIYPTSGGIKDWVYGQLGRLSWTIELRPGQGASGGFAPPSSQIVPTVEENLAAVLTMGDAMAPRLLIQFPEGTPAVVAPDEPATVRVDVKPGLDGVTPGSPRLYWRVGTSGAPSWTAMTNVGGTAYEATLPATECGEVIQYVVQATSTGGAVVKYPALAFAAPLQARVADEDIVLDDDCETNTGWSVSNAGLTAGAWVRNSPQATAAQPAGDHTPAPGVYCYVTDHRAGTSVGQYDVDGGSTTLTSPVFDGATAPELSEPETYVSYWRWFSSDRGMEPGADPLVVQVSANNGATWTTLEQVRDNAGVWVRKEFRLDDYVTPTTQMRLRFITGDLLTDSVVEAAVDDLRVKIVGCRECYPDCNHDGALNLADFGCFQTQFAAGTFYADCNGDFVLNLADFGCYQTKFAQGCP